MITVRMGASPADVSTDPVGHVIERMLEGNGQWLVTVHNHRITKLSKVPKPEVVDGNLDAVTRAAMEAEAAELAEEIVSIEEAPAEPNAVASTKPKPKKQPSAQTDTG